MNENLQPEHSKEIISVFVEISIIFSLILLFPLVYLEDKMRIRLQGNDETDTMVVGMIVTAYLIILVGGIGYAVYRWW